MSIGQHVVQVKAKARGFRDSNYSTPVTFTKGTIYNITVTLSNATSSPDNATTIIEEGTVVLVYTFDGVSYECPTTSPVVTGATGSWVKNSATQGTMTLTNPTSNVSFTVSGESI